MNVRVKEAWSGGSGRSCRIDCDRKRLHTALECRVPKITPPTSRPTFQRRQAIIRRRNLLSPRINSNRDIHRRTRDYPSCTGASYTTIPAVGISNAKPLPLLRAQRRTAVPTLRIRGPRTRGGRCTLGTRSSWRLVHPYGSYTRAEFRYLIMRVTDGDATVMVCAP
jgi:hypothetical protein